MAVLPAGPAVDRPLTPVVVSEGETAKFMVKVCGEPAPSVTWYVNNVAVYNVSTQTFNGFRFLAALLHGTLVVGVSQTLWR